jgi:hypothetical protein
LAISKPKIAGFEPKVRYKLKLNFSYLLVPGVALALAFCNATAAYAQEEGIPGYELQDPMHPGISNEEKTLLDNEGKSYKTPHDSTAILPRLSTQKKTADSVKPSGKPKDEEDPLSFNFLYYIIQKFKVSDIIDQN